MDKRKIQEKLSDEDYVLKLGEVAINNYFKITLPDSIPGVSKSEMNKTKPLMIQESIDLFNSDLNLISKGSESVIEKMFLNSLLVTSYMTYPRLIHIYLDPFQDDMQSFIDSSNYLYEYSFDLLDSYTKAMNKKKQKLDLNIFKEIVRVKTGNNEKSFRNVMFMIIQNVREQYNYSESLLVTLQPILKINDKIYRPDILVWTWADPKFRIIIECDGFEYHSKNKNYTADRQRDRVLSREGFKVLRYSGSEIYNYPEKTSSEIVDTLILERKKIKFKKFPSWINFEGKGL